MTLSLTEIKEIRRFGLIAFGFFGFLSGLGLCAGKPIPLYLFGILCVLGGALFCLPGPLKPVYTGWIKTAHFLGRAVSLTMLALAYYLVITPSAMIKRLFGGPPIPFKPDKATSSYWVTRKEPGQPPERFVKRY